MRHYLMPSTRISAETRAQLAAAWPDLMDTIADGVPIGKAIKDSGFSPWIIRAYRAENKEADAEWARAKEESANALMDQLHGMANSSHADPKSARVNMQALMWMIAKLNPRLYSDKMQIDHTVKHFDVARIISEARARVLAGAQPRILEHETVPLLADRLRELL